jgi:ABC-type multidrug transport system fused ATPase/permease subunit
VSGPAAAVTPPPVSRAERRQQHRSAPRLLLDQLRPHRRLLAAGGLLGFLGSLAALAQPLLAKTVVDSLGQQRSLAGPVTLLAVALVTAALLNAGGSYLLGRAAESVVLGARQRLVARLLRLPVAAVDRLNPGDLLARVVSDTTLLRGVSSFGLVQVVNAVLALAGAVVLMGLLDPLLLGVTLAVLALNGLAVVLVVPRIRRATERSQAALGGMGVVLERSLGAFRTVKASGAEQREIAAAHTAAGRAWQRGVEVAGWTAVMEASTGLAVQASFLVVLGLGGSRVAAGALPVSSLIAFLLYLLLLSEPLTALVSGAGQVQAGLAAVSRMQELHALPAEPGTGEPPAWRARQGPARVSFDGVWFRYPGPAPGRWVHRDLSFSVPAGGVTAIVGPSGTGKSTVFALLERFHEAQRGAVTVDGVDVRRWPLPELRATLGYVEQDAPILAGTLAENLRLAAPGATDDEVAAVVRLTRLERVIARLPDGPQTAVGHRGGTLSGGERQRIAVARALLRRPRVLLLDEATSQLDAVNEEALRDVVADVGRTTTVLVVAHRLSSVVHADRIVVLDRGRVRAVGTHAELLAHDELYRRLVATQLLPAGRDRATRADHGGQ